MAIISYIDEADIELPSSVAPLQVPSGIDIIVPHDSSDDVRSGDSLCPLSGNKHSWNVAHRSASTNGTHKIPLFVISL